MLRDLPKGLPFAGIAFWSVQLHASFLHALALKFPCPQVQLAVLTLLAIRRAFVQLVNLLALLLFSEINEAFLRCRPGPVFRQG